MMPVTPHPVIWMRSYGAFLADTVKENARSLQVVIGLFAAGMVCGAFDDPALASFVDSVISGLMARFEGFHGVGLLFRIFINNFTAALMAAATGIVFGIFPLLSAFLNGLLLGAVLFTVNEPVQWNLFQRILGVAPHGIFELTAFFFSLALGLQLGTWPFKKEKGPFFKSWFNEGSAIFFKIILPFLLIAATIEAAGIEWLR